MIYSFLEYIIESKDYPLYKGVKDNIIKLIVDSGKIIGTGIFDSDLRELVTKGKCISVTRNKDYPQSQGNWIIIFDTKKLTSSFKVIPFCENPDYYSEILNKNNITNNISSMIRLKEFNDEFWKIKTKKNHPDFGICEELIVTDTIDIKKYVKKIIYCGYLDENGKRIPINKRFDYFNTHNVNSMSNSMNYIKTKLDELGIQNNIIPKYNFFDYKFINYD